MTDKKILIIDDEPDLVYGVQMQLEAAGYKVLTAFDGDEGLTKARNERPDLIILDLMLPKVDGYQVCRLLKFDEQYKKIPILIYSSSGRRENKELGYEVGADAYLVKPMDPEKLEESIRRLLAATRT